MSKAKHIKVAKPSKPVQPESSGGGHGDGCIPIN